MRERYADSSGVTEAQSQASTYAYILIQTDSSKQAHVAQELEQIPGVIRAIAVTGAGLLEARREADRLERLANKTLGLGSTYAGRIPRFAYFAKRRDGTARRTAASPRADNNQDHMDGTFDGRQVVQ